MKSLYALLFISISWFLLGAFYYPKWKKHHSEATISWDASGYYHYLPAIFIYHDLKKQDYMDDINEVYLPSPVFDQTYDHKPSGNKVNKYAIGQAVLFAPFFFMAHAFAISTDVFPADGYSKPYQFAIWFGGLLFSVLGLFWLRKILLGYFTDSDVGWTLLAVGLGTTLMEYAAITNGMNHAWLFTLLCGLIFFTIRFYNKNDFLSAIGIGACLGLSVLTRPTEIALCLIPLLWGINSISDRIKLFAVHWKKICVAFIICMLILSIQMIYWKYVANSWVIYSYRDQVFNWLEPRIWRGLMGVQIGWWTYTPLMLIAMFGWFGLFKKHRDIFWATFITSILAIYITMSWPYWEEGGGLGHRNLIQMYPLVSFPLATVISWFTKNKTGTWIWIMILGLNIYYNAWWSHQAHKGGYFKGGRMTTPFFYSVAGRLKPDPDHLKLLDTKEYFKGTPKDQEMVFYEDFEKENFSCEVILPDSTKAVCLSESNQWLGEFDIPVGGLNKDWLRVEGDFKVLIREHNDWNYAQWLVRFDNDDLMIKENSIRIQRLVPTDNETVHLFFDVKIPKKPFNKCVVTFWNVDSRGTIVIDNLKASAFND